MKRISIIMAVLLTFVFVISGCAGKQTQKSVEQANERVKAFNKLLELKTAQNMEELKKLYNESLKPLVTEADKIATGLAVDIDENISRADKEANKSPGLNGVEKLTSRAFYTMMRKSLDDMEKGYKNKDTALNDMNVAKAYYAVVDVVAKRRGSMFNDQTKFSNQFTSMFSALEKEVNVKNKEGITEIKNQIVTLADKVYFLSTLFETKGLIDARGKSDDKVSQDKKAEGSSYFKIIKDSAKDKNAARVIADEFAKPANDINASLIKDKLKVAFPEFAGEFSDQF